MRSSVTKFWRDQTGSMTIEFVIWFPILVTPYVDLKSHASGCACLQYCAYGVINKECSEFHAGTRNFAKTSAMIETAISAGVAAAIFNPIGPCMRPI